MRYRYPTRSAGFSLVETLAVISFIAALAAISWPRVKEYADLGKLRAEARLLHSRLERARLEALQFGAEVSCLFGPHAYACGAEIPAATKAFLQSSPEEFTFYPDGVASPGSIRLELRGNSCRNVVSLRGRTVLECGVPR